jgi:hypothetical protein
MKPASILSRTTKGTCSMLCFTTVKAEERHPCKATSASFRGKRLERSTTGI